jgi:hypothetical protein
VVGRHGDALRLKVAAPPVDGRANDACVMLLAELFGVRRADVELISGRASRSKRFRVGGVTAAEACRILENAVGGQGRRPDD